jgi:hypothetical protein
MIMNDKQVRLWKEAVVCAWKTTKASGIFVDSTGETQAEYVPNAIYRVSPKDVNTL